MGINKKNSIPHIDRNNSMANYIMSFHESTLHNLTQPLILFKISRNDIAQCLIFAIGHLNKNTFSWR
jgi:hypothetical protein